MIEVVLDTETTGLSVADGHRIVEIGCIELEDLIPTKKIFHSYINPERKWWSKPRQKYYTSSAFIRMSLGMTDKDIVERVALIMDGRKVRHEYRNKKNPNHKDMYWMQLQGAAAYRWTMHMKPYLGERRKHKIDWIMKEAYDKDINIIESPTMENVR